jgi:hypothetical protein
VFIDFNLTVQHDASDVTSMTSALVAIYPALRNSPLRCTLAPPDIRQPSAFDELATPGYHIRLSTLVPNKFISFIIAYHIELERIERIPLLEIVNRFNMRVTCGAAALLFFKM